MSNFTELGTVTMNDQVTTSGKPDIRMNLLATPSSVILARELVRYALTSWGYTRTITEDSMLVMSEIVTNALIAAPNVQIRLRVAIHQGAPLLECWDPSPKLPTPRDATPCAESGRGMAIIAGYAKDTGIRPSATNEGKIVWALMPISA
ncbi:ATP-binding protein [Spirillospora sp. NPDC127200]